MSFLVFKNLFLIGNIKTIASLQNLEILVLFSHYDIMTKCFICFSKIIILFLTYININLLKVSDSVNRCFRSL